MTTAEKEKLYAVLCKLPTPGDRIALIKEAYILDKPLGRSVKGAVINGLSKAMDDSKECQQLLQPAESLMQILVTMEYCYDFDLPIEDPAKDEALTTGLVKILSVCQCERKKTAA